MPMATDGRLKSKNFKRSSGLGLAMPSAIYLLIFFVLPLILVVVMSLLSRGSNDLLVSCAADGLVKLWSLSLNQNVATFAAFPADAGTVDVTADGQRLVTSGSGSDVLVWDLAHFEQHMAGNLQYQIEQFEKELGDAIPRDRLLDWAEKVLAR